MITTNQVQEYTNMGMTFLEREAKDDTWKMKHVLPSGQK